MSLSLPEFIRRWKDSELSERAGSQSHFIDLCEILNEPHPAAADPKGLDYAFEKHVNKTGDDKGFADVWKRGFFGWEYKGKHKDLKAAYQQLFNYSADLDNPPLLVVCDFLRFEVHTNFTNTRPLVYKFTLDDLMLLAPIPGSDLSALDILRAVFSDPDKLKPGALEVRVTERAAEEFTKLIPNLRKPGGDQEALARFVMRLLFCLFADSVGLLPDNIFRKMIEADRQEPRKFVRKLKNLFRAMAVGDDSGLISIHHFNGGLFRPDDDTVFDLTSEDMSILRDAAQLDWGRVEPAVFGTLFERILDEGKRAQLGAHYTSREDILLILKPVVMAPLRRRWEEVKTGAEEIAAAMETASSGSRAKLRLQLEDKVLGWMEELSHVRILDPACGSGNFLYMALWLLLDMWKEARAFAADHHLPTFLPCKVGPAQLYGIETNVYAHELASVVVWIGYLQWRKDNAMVELEVPILQKLDNIQHRDAIMELDAHGNPKLDSEGNPSEPAWPEVDFIVSNPPFLGSKLMRSNLGDAYVDRLLQLYHDRIPAEADLVTYWFEKAREMVERKQAHAVGMVATQGIRGGANREVLKRIAESGNIFMAWSDREWVNEGAAVHISIVGFDGGDEAGRTLNGFAVEKIHVDLTSGVDTTMAAKLAENENLCFRADEKGGPFDIEPDDASKMLSAPTNVNGRRNSDVLRRWVNADDITGRPRQMWIIDFFEMEESEAAAYELPFEMLRERIAAEQKLPEGEKRVAKPRPRWWLHRRPGSEMRAAVAELNRFIATITTGKYRLFVWLDHSVLPDHQLYVFARSDDYFFGVLHSRPHEVWARAQGTQLREVESGFRYTPTSTFETFPFPWPPGKEPQDAPLVKAIAEAARELVRQRDNWLNPPDAAPEDLAKLTLTNLYNKRPAWLENAHRNLDVAVFAAYGWPVSLTDAEVLERLLAMNHERATAHEK
jgi:type II restriction/modification system DNA methylase subunit YeeA